MKTRWTGITTIALVSALAASASAAESGLLGIRLFDSGVTVVTKYGNPDDIQAVNIGGMNTGGGGMGGPGAGPGGAGGPSVPGGRGSGGGGGASSSMDYYGPASGDFNFGDYVIRQGLPGGRGGGPQGMGGGPGGPPPGVGGPGGPPGGMGGGPAGAPGGGGGAAENAMFTRWVYNRSGSKYGFIIDKKGRVVQIEAIGLSNSRVRTSKGISFGDTFAEVIRKYKTPDGYDISGSNVMARYLTRNKVAFRFSRLGQGKPQVVTGIVVAAGKG